MTRVSSILGEARALLDESQQWAALHDAGTRVVTVQEREIRTDREASRLARAARTKIEDAIARLAIDGSR